MVKIGAKYKLMNHPFTPVGTVTEYNPFTQLVTVVWDDPNLIPPVDTYPETAFSNGNFVMVDISALFDVKGGREGCLHSWRTYKGFNEDYEYCKSCDAKRFKK